MADKVLNEQLSKESMAICDTCPGWKECPQERRGHFLGVDKLGNYRPMMCKTMAAACRMGEYTPDPDDFPGIAYDLIRAEKEQENCRNCPGLDACPNGMRGHYSFIRWEDTLHYFCPVLAACRAFRARENLARLMQRVGASGVGGRFLDRTFENFTEDMFNARALRAAEDYAKGYGSDTKDGLLLAGPVGTGKTHLAVAILLRVISRGYTGMFVSTNDMVRQLGTSYQTDSTDEYTQGIMGERLLVLDDLGKERSTESARTFVYALINRRYEAGLPTIITTNMSPDDLREAYSDAVYSRLCEMCRPLVLGGEDRRMGHV
jgi:DNA replication protein DnaC